MQETQRAKTAYAEYLAMGPGRSLEKLLAEYQERKRTGKGASVPTTRYATLADWSRKHGWQARVAAFEGKQNEALVARSMDDIEKARQESLKLAQAGKMLVAKSMKEGTFRADSHQALTELVKLEMALMGLPVIVTGQTHYRGRGFTHDPESWVNYFKLLGQILAKPSA